jgi:hypothetical protein
MTSVVESMSPHDENRANILRDTIRLRYRMESRRITAGRPGYQARYTPDRGIEVNGGDVVIYDEGSMVYETNGQMIRQWPSGNVRHPQHLHYSEQPDPAIPDMTMLGTAFEDDFTMWDQLRTPGAATHAWSATQRYTQAMGQEADSLRNELSSLRAEDPGALRPELQQLRAGMFVLGLMSAIHAGGLSDENRTRAGQAAHTEQSFVAEERNRRTDANIGNYWQAYQEIGNEVTRQEPDPARLGATRTVHTGRNAQISPNGTVAWRNANVNGVIGDWELRPDGRSRIRNARGSYTIFNADGTPA